MKRFYKAMRLNHYSTIEQRVPGGLFANIQLIASFLGFLFCLLIVVPEYLAFVETRCRSKERRCLRLGLYCIRFSIGTRLGGCRGSSRCFFPLTLQTLKEGFLGQGDLYTLAMDLLPVELPKTCRRTISRGVVEVECGLYSYVSSKNIEDRAGRRK